MCRPIFTCCLLRRRTAAAHPRAASSEPGTHRSGVPVPHGGRSRSRSGPCRRPDAGADTRRCCRDQRRDDEQPRRRQRPHTAGEQRRPDRPRGVHRRAGQRDPRQVAREVSPMARRRTPRRASAVTRSTTSTSRPSSTSSITKPGAGDRLAPAARVEVPGLVRTWPNPASRDVVDTVGGRHHLRATRRRPAGTGPASSTASTATTGRSRRRRRPDRVRLRNSTMPSAAQPSAELAAVRADRRGDAGGGRPLAAARRPVRLGPDACDRHIASAPPAGDRRHRGVSERRVRSAGRARRSGDVPP